MISRRQVLLGAASFGAAALVHRARNVFAAASQPATPVNFDVPAGACDCLTHIFDPQHFAFADGRTYTPEPATLAEIRALHRALRTTRVLIVQPTVYGTDMRCTLDAIKQLGNDARGLAVVDDKASESTLDEMHRIGIRGLRVNLETGGETDIAVSRQRFQAANRRLGNRKWHVEVHTRPSVIEGMKDLLVASPTPVVFDHFARPQAALGPQQPGFGTVLELLRSGKIYVKISAPYLISTQAPDFADAGTIARELVAANPNRILWATNWPHPDSSRPPGRKTTDLAPLRKVDDGRIFNQLAVWVPDAATRRKILVDNPAQLYGF